MFTRSNVMRDAGTTIFRRGEELYQEGAILDFRAEDKGFMDDVFARVKGSGRLSYKVRLRYNWDLDYMEDYSCECAAYLNYEGMCKHCVAVALKYIDEREDRPLISLLRERDGGRILTTGSQPKKISGPGKARFTQTSHSLSRLLQKRMLQRTLPVTEGTYYGRVKLVPEITAEKGSIQLRLSIGTEESHKYVVKDILALAGAIERNEEYSYGKNLTFVHAMEAFAQESRGLAEFVCERAKEYSAKDSYSGHYGYYASYYLPKLREMELSVSEFEEFINLMSGGSFWGRIDSYERRLWRETEEEPVRVLTIHGKEEGLDISVNLPKGYRGRKDTFYFQEGRIYRLNRACTDPVQDFLSCFEDVEAGRFLFIAARDVPVFCREVLPALEQFFITDYSSFDKESYGVKEVAFEIYLDALRQDYITCQLYAVYGDEQKYNVFDNIGIGTERDAVKELQTGQQIHRYFKSYDPAESRLVLSGDEDMLYELLTRGIEEFQQLGQVFVSEVLKSVKVSPAPRTHVGVSLSGDLLELKMTAGDLSSEQLQEILCKYDRKKKFYRLKNGDFINMEGEAIGALFELKEGLGLNDAQLKGESILLPKYRALYLDAEAKEWNALGMERNREFKALIRNMKTVEDNDFEVPGSMENVLREYQKKGYLWIRALKQNGFGGILADDMGLGKTLQVITYLLSESAEPVERECPLALIVCPASLVYNWKNEFERFAPSLPVKTIVGNAVERRELLEGCRPGEILITSYDLLKRDRESYASLRFVAQIIDEAQYIKNHSTQTAGTVKEISAGFRLALTGTPIENRLSELWSIFDYLMPGYLYTYHKFRNDYEIPIVQSRDEDAGKRLQKLIRPFVLRRLKRDVLKDLPEKLEESIFAGLEGEQQELYDAHVKRLMLTLDKNSDAEFRKNKIQILAELTKLRQLCCDPALLYEGYKGGSAKTELCLDIVKNALNGGHKILLFSQFTTMLDRLCRIFDREKISYYLLTGATNKEARRNMVQAFQTDDTGVFCISLKAGGTGLNLTAADIVIHYDPWWNLAVQNQATDRTHRIGQENVVSVYKLIAKDTIEEKILHLQEKKRELADRLLNAEEMGSGSFSREELLELLQ